MERSGWFWLALVGGALLYGRNGGAPFLADDYSIYYYIRIVWNLRDCLNTWNLLLSSVGFAAVLGGLSALGSQSPYGAPDEYRVAHSLCVSVDCVYRAFS